MAGATIKAVTPVGGGAARPVESVYDRSRRLARKDNSTMPSVGDPGHGFGTEMNS
jgi:hypothetical protein